MLKLHLQEKSSSASGSQEASTDFVGGGSTCRVISDCWMRRRGGGLPVHAAMGADEVPYGATGLEDQAPVGATAQVDEEPTAPHVADDEDDDADHSPHDIDEVGVAET